MVYIQFNRYKTSRKQSYGGQHYDSGFEANFAAELDLRQRAGDIERWERQVKIPLVVNGYLIANYYIDFIIYHKDGTQEFTELKGYAHEIWRLKWKIFEALYSEKPGVKLTVIKQRSNWTMRKIKKICP